MVEPLKGIRVLDLCRGYPPSLSSMLMGDFGADVIKVEPIGPAIVMPWAASEEHWSAYYNPDRNKRSIKLNLRSEKGKEIMHKLAQKADVLLENSRPGTMEKLGIGYQNLKDINPRLIFCAVSGFGQTGPYRSAVGHDSNFMAVAGALSMVGPSDGPPCWPTNMVADGAGAGLHPFMGILLALMAREKTGKGQLIDISYTDATFGVLYFDVMFYLLTKQPRRRGQTLQTGSEPCATVYQTKDGEYVTLQLIEPQFWKNFCQHIDRPDLLAKQWPMNATERQELSATLKEIFLTRTRDEWWEWVQGKDIMLAPVKYVEEVIDDPHIRAREMIWELNHPTLGKVLQVGNPLKLSDTPPSFKSFGPLPGQHTEEILTDFGFTNDQVAGFKTDKIIE